MAKEKKGVLPWLEYAAGRVLLGILQALPMSAAFRLGRMLGVLGHALMRRRRAIVRKNLEIVNRWREAESKDAGGTDEPRSIDAQVREVFKRTGANLLCSFSFGNLSPEATERHLEAEGVEVLRRAVGQGRGVVALTVHMGPWEALAHLRGAAQRNDIDAPFGAIYRPFNNFYFERWHKAHRARKGTQLFDHRKAFHAPIEFLRQGGILSVMSDQRVSGGERVN